MNDNPSHAPTSPPLSSPLEHAKSAFNLSLDSPCLLRTIHNPCTPSSPRKEPFDDPAFLFDLKLDSYRGVADTIQRRMLSKNGNRLKRFEGPAAYRVYRGFPGA
jgi:hypothetical protein